MVTGNDPTTTRRRALHHASVALLALAGCTEDTPAGEESDDEETHVLNVALEDEGGDPVTDVTVAIEPEEGVLPDAEDRIPDDDGVATFEVPGGEYTVSVAGPEREDVTTSVVVDGEDEAVALTVPEDETAGD